MKSIIALGGTAYMALGGAIAVCLAAAALIALFAEPALRALLQSLFARIEAWARRTGRYGFLLADYPARR